MIEEICINSGCWDYDVFNTGVKLAYARNYLTGLFLGALCLLIAYVLAKKGAGRWVVAESFFLTLGLLLAAGSLVIGLLTLHL